MHVYRWLFYKQYRTLLWVNERYEISTVGGKQICGAGQTKSMLGLKSGTTNVVSHNSFNGTHPELKESSRMHFVNINPSLCYPA